MTVTDQTVERHSIEAVLESLLATSASANHQGVRARLHALQQKVAAGQLHLAVLGQMKRGKSSLINALLKANVLPTGVLPVTAIITEIRYGKAPGAIIVYSTGGLREEVPISTLADYISEARNPGNKKQVGSVEITYPSAFLKSGIVLIDTPGIGSTRAHNTETTEHYLEQVDAGIVVLSVDPPITEIESRFIRNLKDEIPKLFFILNKTDLASPQEINEILPFMENELHRLQISSAEIFPLSAQQDRNQDQPARGTAASGLAAFEQRLQRFLSEEKRQVLVRSVAGDALEIARTLKFAASIGTRAAAMNPNELKEKRLALDHLLDQTNMEIQELQVLLRQRSADILSTVERDLNAQTETHISEVQSHLELFQGERHKASRRAFGALLEDFLMKEVEAIFRKWKVQEDEKVQADLNALSSRFVGQANAILDRLEYGAGALFEIPVEHLRINCPLRAESHLYYKVERVFYSLDSFLLLLPSVLMRPIVVRRMRSGVPMLLDMNAGRIRFDYLERLQETMNRFELDLRGAIVMVTDSLRTALSTLSINLEQRTTVSTTLDTVIGDCLRLLNEP
jgi:GTPase Era involved in 16S rRNA processing